VELLTGLPDKSKSSLIAKMAAIALDHFASGSSFYHLVFGEF
jgi:hypothetical protein